MSEPKVEVDTNARGKTNVRAGELHALIHDGQVTVEDALNALKKAGVELSRRRFPWLPESHENEQPSAEEADETKVSDPDVHYYGDSQDLQKGCD